MNSQRLLFIDIETIPTPEAIEDLQHKIDCGQVFPQGIPDEDPFKKLSFSACTARIVCIGYATNDSPADVIFAENEAEMLKAFWRIAAEANLFIGHNILDFDLRFIWQRSVILGVKPAREIPFIRFKNYPVFDTMQEWSKWAFRGAVSLDVLTRVLGITSPKEAGIDGSKVFDYYKAGRIEEICDYCRGDVEAVRQVYHRLKMVG